MDSFATAISMALQYGVPLRVLCEKFSHTRFEPSGFTGNPDIPIAKSITDYIFRWLALKFIPSEDGAAALPPPAMLSPGQAPSKPSSTATIEVRQLPQSSARNGSNGPSNDGFTHARETDAPACATCGSITVRSGACYKCVNCGSTTGCS
jgi:ribonucleoside-diphosphate reductase alpha chain